MVTPTAGGIRVGGTVEMAGKSLLAGQVEVAHPEIVGLTEVAYVMFRPLDPDGAIRTCITLQAARADRSPCGTGSSANLAVLHAKGEIAVGDTRISRSIISDEFVAGAIGDTTVGNRMAVLPRTTGNAGYMDAKPCVAASSTRSCKASLCRTLGNRRPVFFLLLIRRYEASVPQGMALSGRTCLLPTRNPTRCAKAVVFCQKNCRDWHGQCKERRQVHLNSECNRSDEMQIAEAVGGLRS